MARTRDCGNPIGSSFVIGRMLTKTLALAALWASTPALAQAAEPAPVVTPRAGGDLGHGGDALYAEGPSRRSRLGGFDAKRPPLERVRSNQAKGGRR